jgi:hypothetical protein
MLVNCASEENKIKYKNFENDISTNSQDLLLIQLFKGLLF